VGQPVTAARPAAEHHDARLTLTAERAASAAVLGFPGATDLGADWAHAATLLGPGVLNNLGDPEHAGREPRNTKHLERGAVAWIIGVMRGDPLAWWGYVTTGSSEGNLHGLWLARERYRDGVLYHSREAHTSIAKAAHLLGLPTFVVPTTPSGALDIIALADAVVPGRPAILALTAGTTTTEATDDVAAAHAVALEAGATAVYVHIDAAMAGPALALLDDAPVAVRLSGAGDYLDSLCISGHKFLGAPVPCGITLARRSHVEQVRRPLPYVDDHDVTISGSRSGHAAAGLWWVLHRHGVTGHRERAERARRVARYALKRLDALGLDAWSCPHAFTVTFRQAPDAVTQEWGLAAAHEGRSRIVTMPGVSLAQVDAFVEALAAATVRT
jgi:histidine decarboxylase